MSTTMTIVGLPTLTAMVLNTIGWTARLVQTKQTLNNIDVASFTWMALLSRNEEFHK
jgi:hypothetical protein